MYNVVLASTVQQNKSVICTYILSFSYFFLIYVTTEHWVLFPEL